MPPDINDFLAKKRAERGRDPALIPARANVRTSVGSNPDEETEYQKLAKEYKVPVAVVRNEPSTWRERFNNDAAQGALDRSKKLGQWLTNPDRAAQAHDDLDVLEKVQRNLPLTAADRIRLAESDRKTGVLKAPAKPKATLWNSASAILTGIKELPDLWSNSLLAQNIDLFGTTKQTYNSKTKQFERRRTTAPETEARVKKYVRRAEDNIARVRAARPKFDTVTGEAVFDGIYSVTLMAPSMAAGVVTRNPVIPLVTAAALTEPEAYVKYRARGGSTSEAFLGAGLETAAEIGFELVPMGQLVRGFGKKPAAKFIRDYFIAEGLSEQATTLAQDAVDTAIANPDKTWGQYLEERPEAAYRTAVATMVMSGSVATADRAARHFQAKSERAAGGLQTAEFAEKLGQIASASKLRERDVSSFENWVNTAAEGTEAEAVYIEAQKLTEVLEQSGMTPEDIVEALPSLQDTLADAVSTNGDVRIPVGELAARSGDLGTALTPHLRIDPEDMSQSEAEVFMQGAKEEFRAETQKALDEAEINDEFAASGDRVQQQVADQLDATGRFTKDVNQAYASLHASFFSTLAKDLGVTPEEAAARYPLQIQSDVGLGDGVFDQNTKAFRDWFGDGKVVDDKGKPLVVYHGTDVNFEVFDVGKMGQNASAEGFGFYFTDNKNIAKGYHKEGSEGSVMSAYLAVRNPIRNDASALPRKETDALVRAAVRAEISKYADEISDYRDSFLSNITDTYSSTLDDAVSETVDTLLDNDTAIDQIAELANIMGSKELALRAANDALGYDGVYAPNFQGGEGDVYLAWFPEQIKSVNNKGTFDPNDANILNQNGAPVFYSALADAIEKSKQPKAPASQWKATLQKTPGVKQEELEWSGLLEMLDFDPKAVLTREQLAEAVEKGGIVVDEVVLSADGDAAHEERYESREYQDIESDLLDEGVDALDLPYHVAEEVDLDDPDAPPEFIVFGEHAGGETFGTMEEAEESAQEINDATRDAARDDVSMDGYYREMVDARYDEMYGAAAGPQFQDWSLSEDDNSYRELLLTLPTGKKGNPGKSPSTHWEQPDVVAHLRFAEKQDADGNQVMFVEEVQSDWHQKGRDDGYEAAPDPAKIADAAEEVKAARASADAAEERLSSALREASGVEISETDLSNPNLILRPLAAFYENKVHEAENDSEAHAVALRDYNQYLTAAGLGASASVDNQITAAIEDHRTTTQAALNQTPVEHKDVLEKLDDLTKKRREFELRNRELRAMQNPSGVPNAPFKSSWPALVMKRAIRWAADNGFDRIAWTTGEQQADRYDLAESVGQIEARKVGEDSYAVELGTHSAQSAFAGQLGGGPYSAEELQTVLGKDLTRKAVEGAENADVGRGAAEARFDEIHQRLKAIDAEIKKNTGNSEWGDYNEIAAEDRRLRAEREEQRATMAGKAIIDGGELKIGGDGMKAFYDRNLPNITNKIIKKHGAKVQPMRLPEFSDIDIDVSRAQQRGRLATVPRDLENMRERLSAFENNDRAYLEQTQYADADQQKIDAEIERTKRRIATLETSLAELEEMGPPSTLAELNIVARDLRQQIGQPYYNRADRDAAVARYREQAEGTEGRFAEDTSKRLITLADELEAVPDEMFAQLEQADAQVAELRAQLPPTNLGFDVTPELAKAATGGFALFQNTGAARGQLALDKDGQPAVMSLLRGADLSTFLHETGHYFLEVMADVAVSPDAPTRVRQDFREYLSWSGVKSIGDWGRMSLEQKREHHERFARGFEAYLYEGRAPSVEAKSMFQRFRSWLMNVYKNISQLDVELTDEVRGVFDRMLASEQQIKEVEQLHGVQPFLTDKPEGMSEDEWAGYQEFNSEATEEAITQLEARSLRDMKFAGSAAGRELKKLQSQVKTRRKVMREEVEEDMAEDPTYRAIRYLRNGEMNGEPTENAVKLSWDAVKELHATKTPDELKRIRSALGAGKYGILGKDGATPDEVAPLFGFTSGAHMVDELLLSPKTADMIDAETDVRMSERYGDLNSPEALKDAVDEAIHNKVRGRFIATEYAALAKAQGQNSRVIGAAAKRLAAQTIARLRVRDIKPAKYEAAERRAAKAAQQAAGKDEIARATSEKRNQLFNFHSAKEARNGLDEVDKAVRYFKKFDKTGVRKNLDHEYRDQIDKLLERFDLRTSVTNKAADKRKALLSWVEKQEEQGFSPAIDEDLLDEARRQPYREMTLEELRGLKDAVRNIEHLARMKKKLLTAKDAREFADAVADIDASIRENAFKTVDLPAGSKSWLESQVDTGRDYFAMHRKFANIAQVMDGGEYGPTWERLIKPMNDAGDTEAVMNEQATVALGELFKPLENQNVTQREYIPEIGASMSLEDRLMVALNMGNEGNLQRLMDGDAWEQDQVNAVVQTLTAEHWQFVQDTWDFIDGYWAAVRDKELRVTGLPPQKVDAMPLQRTLADGTEIELRGGYFPIKYDADKSSKAAEHERSAIIKQQLQGAATRAQTRRGHTKERSENVDRPVRKDFGVIFEHVAQVTHDLSWHEYLIDANRLVRANAVDSAIREHYGPHALRWINQALEDIAIGDLGAQNGLEKTMSHLRAGVSITGLGWNLWTSLLQPVGLTQSSARIGTQWVAKGAARILGDAAHLESTATWIYERSDFMRLRAKTMQREINEIRNKVSQKSPVRRSIDRAIPAPVGDAIAASYFMLIAKAQLIADMPTWVGQYEKSMSQGIAEDAAAAHADQAVIDSQGGGQIKDLAGIQRGGVWLKLFTNFYSYFNVTYNLLADRTAQLRRVGPTDLPFFAVDVLMLTALPATITAIMGQALKGDEDEWDDLPAKIVEENISYATGLLVGPRELQALSGSEYGARYQGPAGARVLGEMNKLIYQSYQGEADEALLRSANNTAGILFHYPAGQVDRTVRGLNAMVEGEAGPLAPLTGPPSKN